MVFELNQTPQLIKYMQKLLVASRSIVICWPNLFGHVW